jgi:hypothetical protein
MIDPRITEWIEDGCPGESDFCLHIPSFILTDFLRRKTIDNLITFLVSDLVLQIKEGDKPTIDEVKVVCDALIHKSDHKMRGVPKEEGARKILDLPRRKK